MMHKKHVFPPEQIGLANKVFESCEESRQTDGVYKRLGVFESHEIFIDMMVNPLVVEMCRFCLGENYRFDHANTVEQNASTGKGNHLHGKNFGKEGAHFYLSQGKESVDDGTCWTRTGQLTVGICLKSQEPETGGLCYIKGSHKSSYYETGQNIRSKLLSDEKTFKEHVTIPKLDEGDVIFFPENLIHGQSIMSTNSPRRMVYAMFFPAHSTFEQSNKQVNLLKRFAKTKAHKNILRDAYIIGDLDNRNETTKVKW